MVVDLFKYWNIEHLQGIFNNFQLVLSFYFCGGNQLREWGVNGDIVVSQDNMSF